MKCIYIKKLKELISKKPDDGFILERELKDMCDQEVFFEFHGSGKLGEPNKINATAVG